MLHSLFYFPQNVISFKILLFLPQLIFTFFVMHALKFKYPPHYLKVKESKKKWFPCGIMTSAYIYMNILWSVKHTLEAKGSKGLNSSDILTSFHSRKSLDSKFFSSHLFWVNSGHVLACGLEFYFWILGLECLFGNDL